MFRLANVDPEAIRTLDRAALRERLTKAVQDKEFKFYRVDPVIGPALPAGILQVNMTGISGLDGTKPDDLSKAEIEGRRQVFEYLKFFRKYQPGFEKAEICQVGAQVGIRETRRVLGEYLLNEKEVLTGKKFDDGIALGDLARGIPRSRDGQDRLEISG